MRVAVVSFTKRGAGLCSRVVNFLSEEEGIKCRGFILGDLTFGYGLRSMRASAQAWSGEAFKRCDEIIFISDVETAVRSIAPHIKDRRGDPGVIVIDEKGRNVIPVLGGRERAYTSLTAKIAAWLPAAPVITWEQEESAPFSADAFAVKNNLFITDTLEARRVSAGAMSGRIIHICCPSTQVPLSAGFSVSKILSRKVMWVESSAGADIMISCQVPQENGSLVLVPRQCIWIGVNCRRGTGFDELRDALVTFVESYSLHEQALAGLATIDLKIGEDGLQDLARFYQFPVRTYSAAQLMALKGNFASSGFVHPGRGGGNVSERASLMAAAEAAAGAGDGTFALPVISKQTYGDVSLAAAYVNRRMVLP